MGKKLLVALAILSLLEAISATSVICYHGTWSHYRNGNGKFSTKDTPANLCTHYIYAFVGMDYSSYEIKILDSWLDIDLGGFSDAVNLKKKNPNIKVLVAVGGWNEESLRYSNMAATASSRAKFIASALKLVQTYGFDGLDLDWEYPGRRDSSNANDKDNFSLLLKEFHAVFNPRGLLLTAAVSATPEAADISYDVPVLSKYLNFINVMLYDFHGSWDTETGHNAPLYSTQRLAGTEFATWNINASIYGWLQRGASPSKLALGVPFYGRTFALSSASNVAPGAPIYNGGPAGPYTATSGFWGYNEILEKFRDGGWTTAFDNEQQVPYAYSGSTWLTFDNPASLTLKVNYAKSLGLGAIMVWSLETEDFLGLSGTQYPLLNAIKTALGSDDETPSIIVPEIPIPVAPELPDIAPETPDVVPEVPAVDPVVPEVPADNGGKPSVIDDAFSCVAEGYFRSTANCGAYFYCQAVGDAFIGTALKCSTGLYYDTTSGNCNYPSLVNC